MPTAPAAPTFPPGLNEQTAMASRAAIFDQLEAPVWLEKMAELGFPANTEPEQLELLRLGMQMSSIPDDHPYVQYGFQQLQAKEAASHSPLMSLTKMAQQSCFMPFSQQQPARGALNPLQLVTEIVQQMPMLKEAALVVKACVQHQAQTQSPTPASQPAVVA